jgi:hypothetical protein
VLLQEPATLVSQLQVLKDSLLPAAAMGVMERETNFQFVCQFRQPEYFLPRCFAALFPYGRGCPSDKASRTANVKKHTAHMLCLGGGPSPRRFQQSSKYIFTMYIMEMKRKIGGIAYAAQKSKFDGSPILNDSVPTVGDINKLLIYLNNTNEGTDSDQNINNSEEQHLPNSYEQCEKNSNPRSNEIEMQKLIQRLVPYSQSMQGTAPHIAYERTKLMAMLPSPIMKQSGSCRWFLTMAPSDKYENRTIEVIQDAIIDNSIAAWEQRTLKVRNNILTLGSIDEDELSE